MIQIRLVCCQVSWRLFPFLFLLSLASCQREQATTVAETDSTRAPTPSEAVATATATALPEPVLATVVVVAPTATLVPAASTPTIAPSPTMSIPGLIGPGEYADDINPLTGETVADVTLLQRRPIAIKVSNIARVRPQSGINSADLVFEHYSEGGITRFTAVFYTRDSEKVGSVRSGRLIDLEIPVMFDSAFAYSGSSGPLRLMFRDSSFFDRIISPDFGHGGFERISDPNRPNQFFEDTLFTDTRALRWILDQRGQNTRPEITGGLAFLSSTPPGGVPASELELSYLATNVFWQYDASLERYRRWSDGVAHLDANEGQQLNFKNIVVLGAHHENTDIVEDSNGSLSIQIQIWGEGPVSIFRDGLRFEGRWRREDPRRAISFYDLEGIPLPLSPGNSFFQVVPLGYTGLRTSP